MDLWEFYARVEALIRQLQEMDKPVEADQVETAMRGGATSGEILGRLSIALPLVSASVPTLAHDADELSEWAREAFRAR